ncbi:MAG TPA: hypothetical protein VGM38_01240 [Pseudolysinimonas sp.]
MTAALADVALSAEDRRVLECLALLRRAAGTVYSRDVYGVLFPSDEFAAPSDRLDQQVLSLLNGWFADPLVEVERTGSRGIHGMLELVTDTRYRIFIDLLVAVITQSVPRLHPTAAMSIHDGVTTATVRYRYEAMETPRSPRDNERADWIERAHAMYDELTAGRDAVLPIVRSEQLRARAKRASGTDAIELDVSGMFLPDFRVSEIDPRADGEPTARIRLRARGAVFAGSFADFSHVRFDILDVESSVFLAEHVQFHESVFDCRIEEGEELVDQVVNFRDTTFCSNVRRVTFDGVVVTGDTYAMTFEDSVMRGVRCTFERADLGDVILDGYQLQLLDGTTWEFLETSMADAKVRFVDAVVSGDDGQGAVVFYRVAPLAACDFGFRSASDLRIENSGLGAPIRFANIERLSFWGSSIAGALMTVEPRPVLDRNGGSSAGRAPDKMWFLDAIQRGRGDQRAQLSVEFGLVKEVFHGMGEYELEDSAFVRHMRFKGRGWSRAAYGVLDVVGRFGTSPQRMVIALVATWAIWLLVNILSIVLAPGAFDHETASPLLDAVMYTDANLTQGAAGPIPIVFWSHALAIAQSLSGWFFLGYFFAAFVRRTLR